MSAVLACMSRGAFIYVALQAEKPLSERMEKCSYIRMVVVLHGPFPSDTNYMATNL